MISHIFVLSLPFATAYIDQLVRPSDFFGTCTALSKSSAQFTCTGTKCFKIDEGDLQNLNTPGVDGLRSGVLGLRMDVSDLVGLGCSSNEDCYKDNSNMVCHRGRCACPHFTAFNISTCRCEMSGFCREDDNFPCYSHNNRRCKDQMCSCFGSPNFSDVLLDTDGLFCVLPIRPSKSPAVTGMSPATAVLIVLAVAVALAILAAIGFAVLKNCTCEKGQYKCDDVDTVQEPQVHNATWDYPSLDYIPKDEEIVFTLAQAKDMVGASNASTIHVTDEIVMSPLDQDIIKKGIMYNHDNLAYVEDENHNS